MTRLGFCSPAQIEAEMRFWMDVEMEEGGGMEGLRAEQAVLVRMGVVEVERLRVWREGGGKGEVDDVGGAEGITGVSASSRGIEELERWGVALGVALVEEERRSWELRGEVERLRGLIGVMGGSGR
jgi:hypothetical protein